MRNAIARVLVTAIACAAAGCSFATSRSPRYVGQIGEPECDEGAAAPVLDTAAAVVGTAIVTGLLVHDCTDETNLDEFACESFNLGAATVIAVPTLIAAVSAGYGYGQVRQCRRAKVAFRQRVIENPEQPRWVRDHYRQRTAPPAPRDTARCVAHRESIRLAPSQQERERRIAETPSECF